MSSFTRRLQLRNVRAAANPETARRLRGQDRGRKLGAINAKAPKPLSLPARGSRRRTKPNTWRAAKKAVA